MIVAQQGISTNSDGQIGGGGDAETGTTGDALRAAMRKTAATVAVVTARGKSESRGITVNTLVAISLDPAIVSFSVQRHSRMEDMLASAERYYVHVLDSDQATLARRFAARGRSGEEQFEGLKRNPSDEPRLPQALAILTCEPHARIEAGGDHIIAFGLVTDVEFRDEASPLLYHDRAYHRIGESLDPGEREAS